MTSLCRAVEATVAATLLALALGSACAHAQGLALPEIGGPRLTLPDTDRWYFQTSAGTVHFDPSPEHNNHQQLFNVEWQDRGRYIVGGAFFYNSFSQPSQYVYAGRMWHPFGHIESMYIKLTGGLLRGYSGEHQDTIPFNDLGVAPVILPAIGLAGRRFATELVVFGVSGVMWNVGFYLD
jgi:hypothetical protein